YFLNKEEKLTKNLLYGSCVALAGVGLVVFNGSFILKINPLGDILTLISALVWSLYCILLKKTGESLSDYLYYPESICLRTYYAASFLNSHSPASCSGDPSTTYCNC
ncbi:MAG: DMT family transporter, partial [Bacteroides sp.]|nr:DMT family transporter [Bacteroides sp.]